MFVLLLLRLCFHCCISLCLHYCSWDCIAFTASPCVCITFVEIALPLLHLLVLHYCCCNCVTIAASPCVCITVVEIALPLLHLLVFALLLWRLHYHCCISLCLHYCFWDCITIAASPWLLLAYGSSWSSWWGSWQTCGCSLCSSVRNLFGQQWQFSGYLSKVSHVSLFVLSFRISSGVLQKNNFCF